MNLSEEAGRQALEAAWTELLQHCGFHDGDTPVFWEEVRAKVERAVAAAALGPQDERYRVSCGHAHYPDYCLLVAGHSAPHLMLDDDYPRSGPQRREYECGQHRVADKEHKDG